MPYYFIGTSYPLAFASQIMQPNSFKKYRCTFIILVRVVGIMGFLKNNPQQSSRAYPILSDALVFPGKIGDTFDSCNNRCCPARGPVSERLTRRVKAQICWKSVGGMTGPTG